MMLSTNEIRSASTSFLLSILEDVQSRLINASEPNPLWVLYRDALVNECVRRRAV